MSSESKRTDYWLGEVGIYGYATPIDGPHGSREEVEQAAYLIRSLGMQNGRKFACLKIEQTTVEAKSHGANEEALSRCRSMIGGKHD